MMKIYSPRELLGMTLAGEALLVRKATNRTYGEFCIIDMRLEGDGQLVGVIVSSSLQVLSEHLQRQLSLGRRMHVRIHFASMATPIPNSGHQFMDAEWEFEELPREVRPLGRTWSPFSKSTKTNDGGKNDADVP